MTTLISFLGKGDPRKGYRTATYRFNADVAYTETFFGLALTKFPETRSPDPAWHAEQHVGNLLRPRRCRGRRHAAPD
jgi:hypothetical protein